MFGMIEELVSMGFSDECAQMIFDVRNVEGFELLTTIPTNVLPKELNYLILCLKDELEVKYSFS
ncbi:MAG: hypothetical protein R3Y64_09765 [Peptostreptococcaceae bacterium]